MAQFNPFKIVSTNLIQTLKEVAKDKKLALGDIDFSLLKVTTLVQTPKLKDWTIIEEPLEKLFDEEMLRSKELEVKQEYTLKIKPAQRYQLFQDVQMDIQVNKTKSKALIVFKKGSRFPNTQDLAKRIRNEIYKKKLRVGFVLQQYDSALNNNIIKFTKMIQAQTVLSQDIKFTICSSTAPTPQVDDSLILHYKNKVQKDSSLITGVDAGDLVIEYIKPQHGKAGRGCNARYIPAIQAKIRYGHYTPDPETIKVVSEENSVKYYAKKDGYFKDENGVIKIAHDISIESASFKDTGSINANNNQEVSLHIAKTHDNQDSVGSGVKIDLQEVKIDGTVGSHTSVKAVDLSIGEQTHRSSQLEAVEHAKIKLHRGVLKAKTAQIDILENGTVQAEEVRVGKMLGGEIIAKKIFIEELTSNTTVIASELIEIKLISGEHNKLIIDPNKIESHNETITVVKTQIKELKLFIANLKDEYTKDVHSHQEQLPRIKTFQQRILAATKANKAPTKQDTIRVKQYKLEAKKIQDKLQSITQNENELKKLENKLQEFSEPEMYAKIIYKGIYDGHTSTEFVDSKTDETYSMLPIGTYETLQLTLVDNKKKITY